MLGFSLKLSDKRVDKILSNRGYKKSEIFYSPIKAWFVFWAMLLAVILPAFIGVLFQKFSSLAFQKGVVIILIYFILWYLVIGLLNRSFAITEEEFLIINSNFPFWGMQSFKLEEINEIKISSNRKLKPLLMLGLLQSNYVQIETRNQQKKFYCFFLEVDCYDENWTEKTLDNLDSSLKSKGVNVKMDI